jgi:hypothetical protein
MIGMAMIVMMMMMIVMIELHMMMMMMMMMMMIDDDMIGITGEQQKKFFCIYNVYNAMGVMSYA